ncbi:MAG: NAD(P)H-hydrate dehydratase [Burkholderiaceae bacterium]|jgi:hydroxyethylthiazole kinase-like uncharacterized protein yjeF|nr:NAD(P)H-hydrate dehydratase [Burkholderiaceae bacterium]
MPERLDLLQCHPLFDIAATRRIEGSAAAALPPNALMQRAGLAVARLALALAPHARTVWIACGPGNNGGDGLQAAIHLRQWGGNPIVTWLGTPERTPADAHAAWQRARAAGVRFADQPPSGLGAQDLCIDALLGVGATRAPDGRMADWLRALHIQPTPLLAVDLPTALNADTGLTALEPTGSPVRHTLCLLTLKPGLFTAHGRDACGQIWFDDLGVTPDEPPTAWLSGPPIPAHRYHASHKGSYGDVAVIGGAGIVVAPPRSPASHGALPPKGAAPPWERPGGGEMAPPRSPASHGALPPEGAAPPWERPGGGAMIGAALLAARAALHAGAGRVWVSLLGESGPLHDAAQPELMFRPPAALPLRDLTVVCGCGGGQAVAALLPAVLQDAARLVLDADALNALAASPALAERLRSRQNQPTVLTPHPLEAARLLGVHTGDVQRDRLAAARTLAERFQCTVALKGSGTVVAAPQRTPHLNPTGCARLATPGTGDVLAGLIGARLAAGLSAFDAACASVWQHGAIADRWNDTTALTADALARALTACA